MTKQHAINKIAVRLWGKKIPTNVNELAKLIISEAEAVGMTPPEYDTKEQRSCCEDYKVKVWTMTKRAWEEQ